MPDLTLAHLAGALRAYSGYAAIDVFADDVQELVELRDTTVVPTSMQPLDTSGENFLATVGGEKYMLKVDRRAGAARLSRLTSAITPESNAAVGAVAGAAAGVAIGAAASKKGDGWLPGLILGLLAGAAIGNASTSSQPQARRVFTLAFNPGTLQWEVYDGGLVSWMKEELLPSPG